MPIAVGSCHRSRKTGLLPLLSRIFGDVDRFDLRVVEKSFFTVDTAAGAAGDSLAAVGETVGNRIVAVDLARSIAELLGENDAALDVFSPHACPQSVGRTVGQLQGLFGRRDGADRRIRMEDLKRIDIEARFGAIQGGLQVETLLSRDSCLATGQQRFAAARDRFLLGLQDASPLRRIDDRAKLRPFIT